MTSTGPESSPEARFARSGAWGVVALGFGGAAVTAWMATASTGKTPLIWAFIGICSLVGVVGLYMCFAAIHGWWPVDRHRQDPPVPSRETHSDKLPGAEADLLFPPPPEYPLQVTLEQEKWDDWRHVAWITEMKFRITNLSGQPIRLKDFNLVSDSGGGPRPRLSDHVMTALSQEVQRRRDAYGSMRLRPMDLGDGDSVSGWWVQAAYRPAAGRPRCIFTVTDGIDDTYELEIPARDAQVRRLRGQA